MLLCTSEWPAPEGEVFRWLRFLFIFYFSFIKDINHKTKRRLHWISTHTHTYTRIYIEIIQIINVFSIFFLSEKLFIRTSTIIYHHFSLFFFFFERVKKHPRCFFIFNLPISYNNTYKSQIFSGDHSSNIWPCHIPLCRWFVYIFYY